MNSSSLDDLPLVIIKYLSSYFDFRSLRSFLFLNKKYRKLISDSIYPYKVLHLLGFMKTKINFDNISNQNFSSICKKKTKIL